jgi:hypothetical protein
LRGMMDGPDGVVCAKGDGAACGAGCGTGSERRASSEGERGAGDSRIGTGRDCRLLAGQAPSVYEMAPLASVQRTTSACAPGPIAKAERKTESERAAVRMVW